MGFFSSIWKGVTGAIMKVFSPILTPLAAMMDTGWGKALMLALAVFTMGTALVAAQGAFAAAQTAGQGFISAFIEGGKVFMKSMLGMETGAEAGAGAAGGAGGAPAVAPGAEPLAAVTPVGEAGAAGSATGSVATVPDASTILENAGGGNLSGGSTFGPGGAPDQTMRSVTAGGPGGGSGAFGPPGSEMIPAAPGDAGKIGTLTGGGGGVQGAPMLPGKEQTGNWLTRAAKKGWEYANTDLGGSIIEGIGYGMEWDERRKHDKRYDRMWANPDDPGVKGLRELNPPENPDLGGDVYGQTLDRNRRGFVPSVGFARGGG